MNTVLNNLIIYNGYPLSIVAAVLLHSLILVFLIWLQSSSTLESLELVQPTIVKALFIDELEREGAKTPLSATEVSQRLAEVARDMGAVAGRMQREFLQPLVNRIVYIYKEMGLLELPRIDGREIRIVPVSPLLIFAKLIAIFII